MKAIEIIIDALMYKGYSLKESEHIIARFLQEEAKEYLDTIQDDDPEPEHFS